MAQLQSIKQDQLVTAATSIPDILHLCFNTTEKLQTFSHIFKNGTGIVISIGNLCQRFFLTKKTTLKRLIIQWSIYQRMLDKPNKVLL